MFFVPQLLVCWRAHCDVSRRESRVSFIFMSPLLRGPPKKSHILAAVKCRETSPVSEHNDLFAFDLPRGWRQRWRARVRRQRVTYVTFTAWRLWVKGSWHLRCGAWKCFSSMCCTACATVQSRTLDQKMSKSLKYCVLWPQRFIKSKHFSKAYKYLLMFLGGKHDWDILFLFKLLLFFIVK